MLNYNEIVKRKFIDMDGEPYEVVSSHVARKQQNKPQNRVKLKSLISGRVVEKVYHAADKADEANLQAKQVKYLYANKGEYWFCDAEDASKRFALSDDIAGEASHYVKPNTLIDALEFDEKIIGLKLPIKVELKVKEAPPAVRGNTAQGASKTVTLETGSTINVPLFINEGDVIRINTDTGEYVERVDKN